MLIFVTLFLSSEKIRYCNVSFIIVGHVDSIMAGYALQNLTKPKCFQ